MATFNRKFGNNTQAIKVNDDNKTENQKTEESKAGREAGTPVGDSADTKTDTRRSSNPSSTRVETRTKAPGGANQEVWQQAEAQVSSSFAGLDDKARTDAVQARYDQMVKNDEQVKDWAGGDKEILGDIGQKNGN